METLILVTKLKIKARSEHRKHVAGTHSEFKGETEDLDPEDKHDIAV